MYYRRFGEGLNSLCRLPSFLACLLSILLRMAWALLFKKYLTAMRLSVRGDQRCQFFERGWCAILGLQTLFTIPVNNACDYMNNKLFKDDTLVSGTSLDSNEIISLLKFALSNNYFMDDDKICKQIHGCAMGSPVSPVVGNLCMEAIEEVAINTSEVQP